MKHVEVCHHQQASDRHDNTFHPSAHQLEVRHADRTLLVHLLLVFVLNQTVHQITGVDLVIGHLLKRQTEGQTDRLHIT